MGNSVIERAIVQLGFEIDPASQKEIQSFDDSLDSLLSGAAKLATAFGVFTGAVLGGAAATNKLTSEMSNLAKSVDVSLGFVQALTSEAKQIGLTSDNVVDLVEEMNNKLGEFKGLKEMTAVKESLQILNLEFKELDKLNPEQQFIKIFDAAKNLNDEQKAVSAVDMLMGGEANKLLGHLRNVDGAMLDIINRRLELNFLSEEGVKGAVAFNDALGFITDSATSMWQQFSGLLGNALVPIIKSFQDWIVANRKLIKSKLKEWAEKFGQVISWLTPKIIWLIDKIGDLFGWIDRIIKRLGGFENAMKLLGVAIAAMGILKAVRLIQQFGNAAVNAQLKLFAWIAVIAAVLLLLEDLYLFLEDPEADTVIRRVLEAFEEWTGMDLIKPIREAWPGVKVFLANVWGGFKQFIALVIETFGSFILFFVDAFDTGIGDAWDKLIVRLGDSWKALWPEAFQFFQQFFVDPWVKAFDFIEERIKSIMSFGQSALNLVGLGGSGSAGAGATSAAGAVGAAAGSTGGNNISVSVNAQTNASATDISRAVQSGIQTAFAGAETSMSTGTKR